MIHIVKLAVGATDVPHLARWQEERAAWHVSRGRPPLGRHLTRSTPKRADEVLDGGSIYWVIAGYVQARNRLLAIEPDTAEDGSARCAFVYEPQLIRVAPRRMRPFQGWRYFKPEDAPPDIAAGAGGDDLPPELAAELRELGLL